MWRSAVAHLRAGGHEVRILTTDHREPEPEPAIAEDPDVHRELRWYWHEHRIPRRGLRERLAIERHNLAVLDRHLADFRPDAVSWWAMGGMSMSMLERVRRAGPPAVGVVIDEWLAYAPRIDGWQSAFGRRRPLAALAERATGIPTRVELGRAARWLFVSEYVRDAARRSAVDLGPSGVAHGGVDPQLFPAAPPSPWAWRLLCVGRIDPRKGMETAVRALASLPEARLRIVGEGDPEHRVRLESVISELALGDRVEFGAVPRDRLAAAYAEADAVLFPVTWPEPFGLVPLEAMSVGRPVIATGTGGSREYLRDGENCLLFEPIEDPAALAGAVRRLADDEPLRDRLRAGGHRTAADHNEERFNEAVAEALAEAAAG
jgi:glycosyltransferase involved in cell wall biosynthesis